jgi:hypothetical protein
MWPGQVMKLCDSSSFPSLNAQEKSTHKNLRENENTITIMQ